MNEEQKHEGADSKPQRLDRRESQELDRKTGASESYRGYPGINLLEERDRRRQRFRRELQELNRRVEASQGYRILARIDLLKRSYFVFDGNYLTLKRVLDEFEQPATFLKLWGEKNRDELDLFISDVTRLLHNYLAGTKTLLDHIQAFERDVHKGTGFADEYRERADRELKASPLFWFAEDLRSYMLDKGLPFDLAEVSFSRVGSGTEVDSAVKLDVRELRGWKKWSERGCEYLDALGNKVKLDDVVAEHASVVSGFYEWFQTRQTELHREAFEELAGLEGERERLRQEMERSEDLLELTEKAASTMREERERLIRELTKERERSERLEAELEKSRRPWWRRGRA